MAILNVNPTRMELTNLKGKLTTATRGHKLLKDKRDELMREFIDLVRENKEVRREVEAGIAEANAHMAIARSVMSDEALNVARRRVAAHGYAAEGIHGGLDKYVGYAEQRALNTGGQPYAHHPF